jgi:hypothetical protein
MIDSFMEFRPVHLNLNQPEQVRGQELAQPDAVLAVEIAPEGIHLFVTASKDQSGSAELDHGSAPEI